MTEDTPGGHYTGPFDPDGNIDEGHYYICIYIQDGADPSDDDTIHERQEYDWHGGDTDFHATTSHLQEVEDKIDTATSTISAVSSYTKNKLYVYDERVQSPDSIVTIK